MSVNLPVTAYVLRRISRSGRGGTEGEGLVILELAALDYPPTQRLAFTLQLDSTHDVLTS